VSKAPDPKDVAEFRAAVRDVKRLETEQRVETGKPKPPPRARFTALDRAAVLVESLHAPADGAPVDTGDETSFRRVGVTDTTFKKLQRGQYRVESEIDLHGLRLDDAKQALREFLAEALARRLQCVRIVHGKGLRSGPRGPVLKIAVNMVLRKTAPLLAFCAARRVDGGTGAMYVLLGTEHSVASRPSR
jgi:DNA-nicking Smr family endonuclease